MNRAPTSTSIDGASPPTIRPMTNSPIPAANGAPRPRRSMIPPTTTMPMSEPMMNAVKTQPYSWRLPSSRATIGMTVETASASNATSVTVRTRPSVRFQRPADHRPRPSSRAAAARAGGFGSLTWSKFAIERRPGRTGTAACEDDHGDPDRAAPDATLARRGPRAVRRDERGPRRHGAHAGAHDPRAVRRVHRPDRGVVGRARLGPVGDRGARCRAPRRLRRPVARLLPARRPGRGRLAADPRTLGQRLRDRGGPRGAAFRVRGGRPRRDRLVHRAAERAVVAGDGAHRAAPDPSRDFDHPRTSTRWRNPDLVRHVLYRLGRDEWLAIARDSGVEDSGSSAT